jgi:uncharacterized protein YndB with AHSA1/START domain
MSNVESDARTLVVEREFSYPPEKVWRALTQPHLLAEWLMANDFEPVVGHKFEFRAEPNPKWSGIVLSEVLSIEPNRSLSYTWGPSGDGKAESMRWVVTWTLTPTSSGTHLRMEQSGFQPDQQQNYNGARFGWRRFFANLEQVLARPD